MPFVKLDCGILNSTLWFEREAREVFITALLMAEPRELLDPSPQIAIGSLDFTGWVVPAGWYGFVEAAGVGILARAQVSSDVGMLALERLGSPDVSSRSADFDGRRLVRVDGGFVVLNYMKYRERDYTGAERSRRYRLRKLAVASHRDNVASRRDNVTSHRDITQAEAEAEAEVKVKAEKKIRPAADAASVSAFDTFWAAYPKKTGKTAAQKAWQKAKPVLAEVLAALTWQVDSDQWRKDGGQFIPNPATYLNQGRWQDEPPTPRVSLLTEQGERNKRALVGFAELIEAQYGKH